MLLWLPRIGKLGILMAMPTYEYICIDCQTRVEVVQSFTDANLETCEECSGKLRKIIFPVGIQFKGSGFYSTDRKASQPISRVKDKDKDRGQDKGDSKSDSKGESKEGSASETKSDSKPAEVKSESPDKPKKSKVSQKTA